MTLPLTFGRTFPLISYLVLILLVQENQMSACKACRSKQRYELQPKRALYRQQRIADRILAETSHPESGWFNWRGEESLEQ